MKRLTLLLCLTVSCLLFTACSSQNGLKTPVENTAASQSQAVSDPTGADENTSEQASEAPIKPEQSTSENQDLQVAVPERLRAITGRYLKSVSGSGILVSDAHGPVVFTDYVAVPGFIASLEDGDLIAIKVDLIIETYPARADSFGCELVEKGTEADVDPFILGQMAAMGQIQSRDLAPMVYIDDTLYVSTGRKAFVTCGTADGKITSAVERNSMPEENNQSNFGTGASFTRLAKGAVGIAEDSEFILFLDRETVEYNHEYFKKSDLSEETLEWLKNYYSLPEEEQRAITDVPQEIAAPAVTLYGRRYVAPYTPVDKLPEGYEYIGVLPEGAANDAGLAGCNMYALKKLDSFPDFYLYQECKTPVGENTVEPAQQKRAYVQWILSN